MEQHQIKVISPDFLQEARDDDVGIRTFLFRDAAGIPPDLGDDDVIAAWNAFQRRQKIRMGAVEVGQIEGAHAALIRTFDERLALYGTQPYLLPALKGIPRSDYVII